VERNSPWPISALGRRATATLPGEADKVEIGKLRLSDIGRVKVFRRGGAAKRDTLLTEIALAKTKFKTPEKIPDCN
jgi:hypothetical protein